MKALDGVTVDIHQGDVMVVIGPSGVPGHSWQTVSAGKSSIAHKGMLLAAKVLAASVADWMSEPELLIKAKNAFSITACEGYDCPIPDNLIAGQ